MTHARCAPQIATRGSMPPVSGIAAARRGEHRHVGTRVEEQRVPAGRALNRDFVERRALAVDDGGQSGNRFVRLGVRKNCQREYVDRNQHRDRQRVRRRSDVRRRATNSAVNNEPAKTTAPIATSPGTSCETVASNSLLRMKSAIASATAPMVSGDEGCGNHGRPGSAAPHDGFKIERGNQREGGELQGDIVRKFGARKAKEEQRHDDPRRTPSAPDSPDADPAGAPATAASRRRRPSARKRSTERIPRARRARSTKSARTGFR